MQCVRDLLVCRGGAQPPSRNRGMRTTRTASELVCESRLIARRVGPGWLAMLRLVHHEWAETRVPLDRRHLAIRGANAPRPWTRYPSVRRPPPPHLPLLLTPASQSLRALLLVRSRRSSSARDYEADGLRRKGIGDGKRRRGGRGVGERNLPKSSFSASGSAERR